MFFSNDPASLPWRRQCVSNHKWWPTPSSYPIHRLPTQSPGWRPFNFCSFQELYPLTQALPAYLNLLLIKRKKKSRLISQTLVIVHSYLGGQITFFILFSLLPENFSLHCKEEREEGKRVWGDCRHNFEGFVSVIAFNPHNNWGWWMLPVPFYSWGNWGSEG